MALRPVSPEIVKEMCQALGLPSLNRPHAAQVDPGDWGMVFTYIPIKAEEYTALPTRLKSSVYCFGRNRYGVVVHVPKSFELPEKDKVATISAVYDQMNNLRELGYTTEGNPEMRWIKDSVRQDQLLEYAKKKKIQPKIQVRSAHIDHTGMLYRFA